MADTKISNEASASTLTGPEMILGVQSGGNVKITPTQLTAFTALNLPYLQVASTNPTLGNPSGALYGLRFITTYNDLVSDPAFTNQEGTSAELNYFHGMNLYGNGTTAKYTPTALRTVGTFWGAGEKTTFGVDSTYYGMGDSALFAGSNTFSSGPIGGDEGQCYSASFYLQQQGIHSRGAVTSVSRTAFDTTVAAITLNGYITPNATDSTLHVNSIVGTFQPPPFGVYGQYINGAGVSAGTYITGQSSGTPGGPGTYTVTNVQTVGSSGAPISMSSSNIIGSRTAQDIPVVSTTGANPGDWIVLNQSPESGYPNIAATQIISVNAGNSTINCVCPINMMGPSTFSGYISGTVLTVTTAPTISPTTLLGGHILSGGGVAAGTQIIGIVWSGAGGAGAYQVSISQTLGNAGAPVTMTATGNLIKPALYLGMSGNSGWGQDRVMVNLSGASYTTGTVTALNGNTGGGLIGTSTSWSPTMVGGDHLNVGAMYLDADTYTSYPFNGSPGTPNDTLLSWYQIRQVIDGTNLRISSMSVTGTEDYKGRGPGAGGYKVRPAARILRIYGNDVVCEYSAHTWTVGDTVECVICPYPDVHGWDYKIGVWTPGGIRRAALGLSNIGARSMAYGINLTNLSPSTIGLAGSDSTAFDCGISMDTVGTGIFIRDASVCALNLGSLTGSGYPDTSGKIFWSNTGAYITPNSTNNGIDFGMILAASTGNLTAKNSTAVGSGTCSLLTWTGSTFQVTPVAFSALPTPSSSLKGCIAAITDASSPVIGNNVSSGGSAYALLTCNGANWTVIGK